MIQKDPVTAGIGQIKTVGTRFHMAMAVRDEFSGVVEYPSVTRCSPYRKTPLLQLGRRLLLGAHSLIARNSQSKQHLLPSESSEYAGPARRLWLGLRLLLLLRDGLDLRGRRLDLRAGPQRLRLGLSNRGLDLRL